MERGLEWTYVEELKQGRTTSYVQCKSCKYTFHGSATCIGVNVESYPTPLGDILVRLQKYVTKLESKGISQPRKKITLASQDTCANISHHIGEQIVNHDLGSMQHNSHGH